MRFFFLSDEDFITFFCFISCLFLCVMLFDWVRGLFLFSLVVLGWTLKPSDE